MAAVMRVLAENELQIAERLDETERLASLGRLAATVGHETNSFLMVILNPRQSLNELRASLRYLEDASLRSLEEMAAPNVAFETLKGHIVRVTEMLEECEVGCERIRGTVVKLQQLSYKTETQRVLLDLRKLIENRPRWRESDSTSRAPHEELDGGKDDARHQRGAPASFSESAR